MTPDDVYRLVAWLSVASPVFAAGGAWMAIRFELKSLRNDLEKVERNAGRAHSRIDRLMDR